MNYPVGEGKHTMDGRTYHVTAELAGLSRQRSVLRVLYLAGLFLIINFLLGLVWHDRAGNSIISNLIGSI